MARKRIGFMTNSSCIAKNLNLKCPNTITRKIHDHMVLIDGRAKKAEIYPPSLCRAVCKGLIEQLRADRLGQFMIAELDNKIGNGTSWKKEAEETHKRCRIVEENNDEEV